MPENESGYLHHGRFWDGDLEDEQVGWLAARFATIDMLDIYDAPITRASIQHLTSVKQLKELRLKDCTALQDDCVADLARIKGLELLHLGGTGVTLDGLLELRGDCLQTVFISSDLSTPLIQDRLRLLALSLPGCEVVVNHHPPHVFLGDVV
ncbi:hypothetical protein CDA63_18190 [Hymenobacter amundsenii]|uniref:Uncharacterized protein n=2 Tax=Hymenobacter amundsenii TaxID=2006685 RepID=A0A246FGJ6_9BACT|nr:hypothetical protein CDA63_18190 [Hymenobacter amundsenii]